MRSYCAFSDAKRFAFVYYIWCASFFEAGLTSMKRLALLSLLLPSLAFAAPNWPDLSIPAAPQGGGEKDVAVIIGVESYAELPRLEGANDMAELWYQYLTITRSVPSKQVTLLTNKKGTREKMLKALQEKAKLASKGGTFWVIFIGRGAPGSATNGGLLLGYDTQSEIDSLAERGVSLQEVFDTVKKGKQSKVVALIDDGLNGHVPEGDLIFGIEHEHITKKIGPKEIAAAHKKKAKQDAVILTAAAGEQYAGPLPGADVPAFSYLTLGGVRGWADSNQDGNVTAQEIRDYTASVLMLFARDQIQTPVLAASNTETKLSFSSEGGPDIVALFTGGTPKSNTGSGNSGLIGKNTIPFTTTKEDPKPPKGNSNNLGTPNNNGNNSNNGNGSSNNNGNNTAPSASNRVESIESMLLAKINAARKDDGLPALKQNAKLLSAARLHSEEMATLGYFSHQSPTPGLESFVDRIKASGATGFSTAGENIVFRQENVSDADMAEALFQQWMNSPGHRENILTPDFLVTGLGVFVDGSRCWATQVFADAVK